MLGDFGRRDIVDWSILRTKPMNFGCLEMSSLDICLGTCNFKLRCLMIKITKI